MWTSATWPDPPLTVEGKQDFTFRIETIDLKKRQARIVGTGGATLGSVLLTPVGLTVIEQTPGGSQTITTVFAAGGEGTKYLAVHSRHIGDPTAPPTPSQNYGRCEGQ